MNYKDVHFKVRPYILFIFLITSCSIFGQEEKPKNYRRFDDKLIHFGFMLGGNTADFMMFPMVDAYQNFGVKSITNLSLIHI